MPLPPVATLTRIGGGRSADVYALPEGRVLKLFRDGADPGAAEREFRATGIAAAAGLAVAEPFAAVTVEARIGLITARVAGETATAILRRTPLRLLPLLRDLARYQARMHAVFVAEDDLPDMHLATAARVGWASASPEAIAVAQDALAGLPRGDRLCHGDLHPSNVIAAPDGLVAIDWSQATRGAPAGDVARTELLLRYASYGRALRRFPVLRVFRHLLAGWYRRCYRRASGLPDASIAAWRLPVAVAWLQTGSVAYAPALNRMIARTIRSSRLR